MQQYATNLNVNRVNIMWYVSTNVGKTRTRDDVNTSWSEFIELFSCPLSGPKVACWAFFTLWLSGAARRAEFGSHCLETLLSPRKVWSSLKLLKAFNPPTALVVCDENLRRLWQMRRPM